MKHAATVSILIIFFLLSLAGCTGESPGGGGSGTTLKTEVVDTPDPGDGDEEIPVHNLFATSPGSFVAMSALSGTVDPVGTSITDDFDGDGLINDKETTSNVWVADYPAIATSIATPVTMRIEILYNNDTSTKTISTDIMSEDTENTVENASDKIHRQEVNNKTVQYQDRITTANSESAGLGGVRIDGYAKGRIKANLTTAGIGAIRVKKPTSISVSYSKSHEHVQTHWKDQPFKNDVDASGWAQKDNTKSKRAKQLRSELREVVDITKKMKPNAGYVRAALYITNNTVNMPVRIYEIYCSLMLENNEGKLLPVQNFLLKKDDYTPFELNLYGGTTFGPYVIELERLNTQEIRDAIAKGYNPRIFLIDYKMAHVPDSNYRTALSSSFSGDNLKIIEENAKGRTAGIKFVYPGDRQFFRVSAFDTDGVESRTGSQGATAFAPGVSLEKALTRITYSGLDVQYADIVFDTRGLEPEMSIPRFHVRTIKSINGVEMELPFPVVDSVPYRTIVGNHVDVDGNALGGSSTAYLMKPMDEWTDEELKQFRIWAIFENGRYYLHTKDVLSAGDVPTYFEYQIPGQAAVRVPMVEGIRGLIWPGDHYDIVCLEYQEQEEEQQSFGSNPFETGAAVSFNTKWNLDTIEEYPFQPDSGSAYLGEAILGDTLEFTIKLNQTRYLNPDFGTPELVDGKRVYQAFSYDLERPVVSKKFEIDEAVDFEISFGLGGKYSHWTNLTDPLHRSPSSVYALDTSDRNWNYLDQEFNIRVPIPTDLAGVGPDGTVKVYIRPARNNAYRESVWPLPYTEVKQFRGKLLTAVETGANQIELTDTVGEALVGDTLYLDGYGYQVSAVDVQDDKTVLTLATPLQSANAIGSKAYINLPTPYTEPMIQIEADTGFEAAWNLENSDTSTDNGDALKPLALTDQDIDSPANYLGYTHNLMETNWIGYQNYANPYWNQWTDSSKYKPLVEAYHAPLLKISNDQLSVEYTEFQSDLLKLGSELSISSSNTGTQKNIRLAMSGDKALVIWESNDASNDYDIKGQVINLAKGQEGNLIGGEISVNSNNLDIQKVAQVGVSGDKALVVWMSFENGVDWDIKGQVIDMATGQEGTLLGTEFLVNAIDPSNQSDPHVAVSGDKVFVSWVSDNATYHNNIMGRVFSLAPGNEGTPLTSEFLVNTNQAGDQDMSRVSASDSNVLVVWRHQLGEGIYDIRGQVINLISGKEGDLLGPEVTISSASANNLNSPQISMNTNKAFVVWQSYSASTSWDIRGRFIHLASGHEGELIGTELSVNTDTFLAQENPQLAVSEDSALVVWDSDSGGDRNIKGRLINMKDGHEGEFNGPEIDISTSNSSEQYTPQILITKKKALVVWPTGHRATGYYDIFGQVIDMNSGHEAKMIGTELFVNTDRSFDQVIPKVSFWEGKSLVVWQSFDNGVDSDIKGQVVDLELISENLNYFTAPLLERDYEVKAKILEE